MAKINENNPIYDDNNKDKDGLEYCTEKIDDNYTKIHFIANNFYLDYGEEKQEDVKNNTITQYDDNIICEIYANNVYRVACYYYGGDVTYKTTDYNTGITTIHESQKIPKLFMVSAKNETQDTYKNTCSVTTTGRQFGENVLDTTDNSYSPNETLQVNEYDVNNYFYYGIYAMNVGVNPTAQDQTLYGGRIGGVCNVPCFSNFDLMKKYLAGIIDLKDIPPDSYDYTDGSPEEKSDENDSDGTNRNESDNMSDNDSPITTPYMVNGGCNYYIVDCANVNAFVDWLWNDIIKEDNISEFLLNTITKVNNTLSENILGCMLFPFDVTQFLTEVTSTKISLGRFSTNFAVINGESYKNKIADVEINIPFFYNNFLDYEPYTKRYVYLPYVGVRPLDGNIFQPKTKLKITVFCDITTGVVTYVIKCVNSNNNTYVVDSVSGSCGIDIPMSYNNSTEYISNMVNSVLSTTTNELGRKNGNIVKDTFNILENQEAPKSVNVGTPTPSNALYMSQDLYLITERPTYNRGKTYGKNIGYPCMQSYKLDKIKGYFEIINPKIKFGKTKTKREDETIIKVLPLNEEKKELYDLLEKGVYGNE